MKFVAFPSKSRAHPLISHTTAGNEALDQGFSKKQFSLTEYFIRMKGSVTITSVTRKDSIYLFYLLIYLFIYLFNVFTGNLDF